MHLIETIRICNRRPENIEWHNERFNRSRKELFGEAEKIDLKKIINIPDHLSRSVYKCRIIYQKKKEAIEFIPYKIKKINSLALVTENEINYSYKYADRSIFEKLKNQNSADEIIIVKNGFLTDTSYANLVFFDGEKWLTPATPLLAGTMRAKLLAAGKIQEAKIRPADLSHFQKIKLINAMLGFENSPAIPLEKLIK